MNAAVRDSLVTGYEPLIDGLTLPDQDDRHVLAAAVHSGAQVTDVAHLSPARCEHVNPYGKYRFEPARYRKSVPLRPLRPA